MDRIGHSIEGKLRALGNFAASFTSAPQADIQKPEDLVELSGNDAHEKEWTILVYLEGRNKLAFSTNLALNKMEHIGSDSNVNIVAQATVEPTLAERFAPGMRPLNTRRYYIRKDDDKVKINSPVVGDSGARLPLSSDTMADFLSWGMEKFPAKHYMVIVKKHGLGFAKTDKFVPLSARDLNSALEKAQEKTGKKVDVVSFDSCSMGQMEVAYELSGNAKVMTASQEDILAVDYPYDRIMWGMEQNGGKITPKEAGELVVDAHRSGVPNGIQTAVDLDRLKEAGEATKDFVEVIIAEKVPPSVIYTNMLKSPSLEPGESMRLAFNFRDGLGFLESIINDNNIKSERVKEKALALKEKLQESIIDHHIGQNKKRIKDGKGFTVYMPWNDPPGSLKESYSRLRFDRDGEWTKLIDYVFDSKEVSSTIAPEHSDSESLSLGSRLGKKLIKNYKQYVSPYLPVACKHTPSCSQYGREAIEKHGLIQGAKMAFMRVLSCNENADGRYDPVPPPSEKGEEVICRHSHGEAPPEALDRNIPEVLINPPGNIEKSEGRRRVESLLIKTGRLAGKIAGGLAGALIALPIGIAMGATLGTKAGMSTINSDINVPLLRKYSDDSVRQFVKIENVLCKPAGESYRISKEHLGSETAAKIIGGVIGAVTGTILGAAGAMWKGYSWGSRFAGLFGENYIKDKLGELPKHPITENILHHCYNEA